MSIYTAPFKSPNYIYLNQREHDLINPDKEQGCQTSGTGFCRVCHIPTKYMNQQLCNCCRSYLIRGDLFPQYTGELKVVGDEYKEYIPLVTDSLVNKIDTIMNHKFKTRCNKSKVAKMLCIMQKFIDAGGAIEADVAYRRLRYYANTAKRDGLQRTLQDGKKLFDLLFRYMY